MTQPTNRQEYDARYFANYTTTGYGLEVAQEFPCHFCAAPGFFKSRVLDLEAEMQKDHTCSECGRSARAIVQRDASGVQFEVVQTGGDDPPDYLPPMRRA